MMSLSEWRSGGGAFEHRGHRIFWREGGSKGSPVLLLIHGFPTGSWDWESVWADLARDHHVLTLDMIGFGFSAKPVDYSYSIVDQADLFEAFLRGRDLSECHVLAHDYGDTVAQELLARQDDGRLRARIRSVCFLNGGLFPETHRPLLTQTLLASPVGGLVARLMTKHRLAEGLRHIFGRDTPPNDEVVDAFWQLITASDGQAVMPKLIGYMRERKAHRERWVGALTKAIVPLKVIDGLADPISGAHMVARYREVVPSPDTTGLEGIGHWPQVEAPALVLEAYRGFRGALLAG